MSLARANNPLPTQDCCERRTDLCHNKLYVAKRKTPELDVGGHWYNVSMNTIDESFLCSTCGEQYAYCGCMNDEAEPFSQERECSNCEGLFPVLFLMGGSPVERCADCHNEYAARNGMR